MQQWRPCAGEWDFSVTQLGDPDVRTRRAPGCTSGPKTIWMYVSQPNLGGAQLATLDIADEIAGHKWTFVAYTSHTGPFVTECRSRGHACHVIPMPENYRFFKQHGKRGGVSRSVRWGAMTAWLEARLLALLIRERPTLAYLFGRREAILCAPWLRLLRIPAVYHVHAWPDEPGALDKMTLAALGMMNARVVANSRSSLKNVRSAGWKKTVEIIYNGFRFSESWDQDTKAARKHYRIPEGARVIGTACRFTPLKNVDKAIRTAALLKQKWDEPFVWLMAGEEDPFFAGRLLPEYLRLAEELRVAGEIRWLGRIADMSAFYRALDAFVLIPSVEPLGRVFIEAMAAGIPTLGTQVGGIPEFIEHGKTGWLVLPDRPDLAAEVLAGILTHVRATREIAAQGRETVRRRFAMDTVTRQLLEVFDKACSGVPAHE